jgi:hypothetical protein
MIHLGTTRMNRVPRRMSFIYNLLFECFFPQHNQSILEPQGTLRILAETSNFWVTFLYLSLDVGHTSIILLGGNDLTPQGGCEVMFYNDKSSNTQVLDSSPVERTASK